MPPEYIKKRQISSKFDVFSLGVIIIQIMAGPDGYSVCGDVTAEEFAELVRRIILPRAIYIMEKILINFHKLYVAPTCMMYPHFSFKFRTQVHRSWGKRLEPMPWHTSQEVKTCIQIALRCVEEDRAKRPTISKIVDEFKRLEIRSSPIGQVSYHTGPITYI